MDFSLLFFSFDTLEYSFHSGAENGINDPEYLANLEKFATWLRGHEQVEAVYSISDIVKRLNRDLHNDDPAYYRLPDNREEVAQYLLLYELSLPYGLDLNDRFNIDKSASRLSVTVRINGTNEGQKLVAEFDEWIRQNLPAQMQAQPTSIMVMFSHIAQRNIDAMLGSTVILLLVIGGVMMLALRSFWLGLLSLIPTILPIAVAMGIWALLVGKVGMSVSVIAAVSLGIIIDNAVHLISKFVRAQRDKGLDAEAALRYTYNSVGLAIFFNTVILAIGFLLLTASVYLINVQMGALTTISIVTAYFLDFLMLPALLLTLSEFAPKLLGKVMGSGKREGKPGSQE